MAAAITATGAPAAARDSRRWLVLVTMCLSLLLIVVDNTIVNVALPTIRTDLDASASQLQWIVDAYILVFAGLLLTMGALGDRFGRRGALAVGLSIMGIASIASAFANSADQLIATRATMGIGGALVMPATLSIITNVFTDPKERAQAIAIWSATAGMAIAIGPVTGGFLIEHYWWGSVFLINLPVIAVAVLLGRLFVPTSKDPTAPPVDIPGALLSIGGLVSLVYAIIEGPNGWTEPNVVGGFVAAAVLLTAFALWERRTPHPMLDIGLFSNPRFSAASGAISLTFFAMFGTFFLLTQFLQSVMGYTALQAGVRLLPMAATQMIVAPTSARMAERFGSKVIVALGLAIAAVGLLMTSRLTAGTEYFDVALALVVMSVGFAMMMPSATEAIMGSVPPEKAGVGSAVNDTTRELGGAFGVAVLGSIVSSTYGPDVREAVAGTPLPASAVNAVSDQVGAAMEVASRLPTGPAQLLHDAAANAFVDGMSTALTVGAGALALGAIVVALFLPARARDAAGHGDSDGDGGDAHGDGSREAALSRT
ncbi:MAG TPA: DHA2 family efflux MFS transporter permease subunit [Acidimicrobiales bacterium]|nr:DHA2 family efflux MFS transporter permease subunit [Acidimicrobiales bacterium]